MKNYGFTNHFRPLYHKNRIAAKQGGAIAGNARKALEAKTGKKVITSENYLPEGKKIKQLSKGKRK